MVSNAPGVESNTKRKKVWDNFVVIDDLNVKILKEFYNLEEGQNLKPSEIARRIFPRTNNKVEYTRNVEKVCDRIRALPKDIMNIKSAVSSNGDCKTVEVRWYELVSDNIEFFKCKFPDCTKEAIALKINCKWQVYEI